MSNWSSPRSKFPRGGYRAPHQRSPPIEHQDIPSLPRRHRSTRSPKLSKAPELLFSLAPTSGVAGTAPTSRGACAGSLVAVIAACPRTPTELLVGTVSSHGATSIVQSRPGVRTLPCASQPRPESLTRIHRPNRKSEQSQRLRSLLLPQVHAPGSPAARTRLLTKQRQRFVRHQRERLFEFRIDAGELTQRRLDLRWRQLGT